MTAKTVIPAKAGIHESDFSRPRSESLKLVKLALPSPNDEPSRAAPR
jgi:hypothetical protein